MNGYEISYFAGIAIFAFIGFSAFIVGFLTKASGKYKVAQKCIEIGRVCVLLSGSFFALLVMALGHKGFGILIFASIGLGLIMKRSRINMCPSCGELIGMGIQLTHFTKWGFFRQSSNCPNCKVRVILAKWPWRAATIGSVCAVIYIFLRLLKVEFELGLCITPWVTILLFCTGIYTLKFEILDKTENNEQTGNH